MLPKPAAVGFEPPHKDDRSDEHCNDAEIPEPPREDLFIHAPHCILRIAELLGDGIVTADGAFNYASLHVECAENGVAERGGLCELRARVNGRS